MLPINGACPCTLVLRPGFLASLRQQEGVAARTLEFAILAAARTGEVIGGRWDLDKTWTVPLGRMKGRRERRLPLSPRALAVVLEIQSVRAGDADDNSCLRAATPSPPASNGCSQPTRPAPKWATPIHGLRLTQLTLKKSKPPCSGTRSRLRFA